MYDPGSTPMTAVVDLMNSLALVAWAFLSALSEPVQAARHYGPFAPVGVLVSAYPVCLFIW
jgi:hypothetical protein